MLERCVPDLAEYQSTAYAREYAGKVMHVAEVERERTGVDATPVAVAYAHGLHKLMAYKDEYEVARLYLDQAERARITQEFGPGAKVRVLLHPPLLRTLGVDHKLRLGPWIFPAFRALRGMRRVRGTAVDPFGKTRMRRLERALVAEYDGLVVDALELLGPDTAGDVLAIAELPDLVRGYEDVKVLSVERFREQAADLLLQLGVTDLVSLAAGEREPAVARAS